MGLFKSKRAETLERIRDSTEYGYQKIDQRISQDKALSKKLAAYDVKKEMGLVPKKDFFGVIDRRVPLTRLPSRITQPSVAITKEQAMLKSMFGHGEKTWGTGQNLPDTSEEILRSGGGLVKNGDYEGRTGAFFGIRRRRWE